MWTNNQISCRAGLVLLTVLALSVPSLRAWDSAKSDRSTAATTTGVAKTGATGTAGQSKGPNEAKNTVDDYIIGPSDILAIDVWKDAELTRIVTVRPDGKYSLPLIGELEVSGSTAPTVQRLIARRLTDYISDPQVSVMVQEVKSQTYVVVGKVGHPGSYALAKPTTVLDALAIAGGLLEFAKSSRIYVIRRQNGGAWYMYFDYKRVMKGRNPEQNVDLKSGDTIVVP